MGLLKHGEGKHKAKTDMNNPHAVQQFTITELFHLTSLYRSKLLGVRNQRKEETRPHSLLVHTWYITHYKNGLNWCNTMLGCKLCAGGARVLLTSAVSQRLALR